MVIFICICFVTLVVEKRFTVLYNFNMYCLSVNHKTADISVRQLFSFTSSQMKRFIISALSEKDVDGCVLLCTCNRTEIYFCGTDNSSATIKRILCEQKSVSLSEIEEFSELYSCENALLHLFNVACGFESAVIGEDEILGQLKKSFYFAKDMSATNTYLNIAFRDAFTCAKDIKTNTDISKTPVSIATLTANLASSFKQGEYTVLIIGITGEMGSLIAKNLSDKSSVRVIGTVRRNGRPKDFLPGVEYIDYCRRYEYIDCADVIISATLSPHHTLEGDKTAQSIRNKKKRLFIDLSIPPDIDEKIISQDNRLCNIDYFKELSLRNNSIKQDIVNKCEKIIKKYVNETQKSIYISENIDKISSSAEKIGLSLAAVLGKREEMSFDEFVSYINRLKE